MFEKLKSFFRAGIQAVTGGRGYGYHYGPGYGPGGGKWPGGLSTSVPVSTLNHYEVLQQARSATQDSVEAAALVERWADTEVDTGLVVEFTPNAPLLGITDEAAERWATDHNQRIDLWFRSKGIHRAETMTGYQLQRLYAICQQRDNDQFVRLYYSKRPELLSPVQMGFVDPNQIRGFAFTSTYMSYDQDDGIVRDTAGRETAYKIWVQNRSAPEGALEFRDVTVNRIGARSKRIHMLHGFDIKYPGQGRGFSRLAPLIQDFENLTDFKAAHIKKAINQANITIYTKPSNDEDAPNPFEGIGVDAGAGPAAQMFGSNPTPPPGFDGPLVDFQALPEAQMAVPGSVGVFNLTRGADIKPFESTSPADSYDKFVDTYLGSLTAVTGMGLEAMLLKFGNSFSASRALLILLWRKLQILQSEMDYDLITPLIEMWLFEEIAAGRTIAPGWMDPRLRAAWMSHKLYAAPMPNIDPQKTANAMKTHAEMGLTTLDRESRNLNGSSGKTNRAKLTREYEELPESPFKKPSGPIKS